MKVNRRGEKSLAGLMADPAFRPKLRWIAVSPRPIVMGTKLLSIFMFLLSVTARMMMRSMAVPRIWSIARLRVVTCLISKKG